MQAEDIVSGFEERMRGDRLQQKVMFGELVGGKGYPEWQTETGCLV